MVPIDWQERCDGQDYIRYHYDFLFTFFCTCQLSICEKPPHMYYACICEWPFLHYVFTFSEWNIMFYFENIYGSFHGVKITFDVFTQYWPTRTLYLQWKYRFGGNTFFWLYQPKIYYNVHLFSFFFLSSFFLLEHIS